MAFVFYEGKTGTEDMNKFDKEEYKLLQAELVRVAVQERALSEELRNCKERHEVRFIESEIFRLGVINRALMNKMARLIPGLLLREGQIITKDELDKQMSLNLDNNRKDK